MTPCRVWTAVSAGVVRCRLSADQLVPARVDPLQAGDPGQIGPFRLLGRLGEGGMGRVFLGESRGGRRVAVKVVHPH